MADRPHRQYRIDYDPTTGMKIVFQNADSACEDHRNPKAISGKGPAATKAVDLGQHNLFSRIRTPKTRQWRKKKTRRFGTSLSKLTAMTFAPNCPFLSESKIVNSTALTSASTSSSQANGRT
jgi:hypothetical protein